MKKIRVGVIGCGVIGQRHVEGAVQGSRADVVAVADVRAHAARECAQRFDVPRVYSRAGSLLADDEVDAVVLAVPTRGRARLAYRALQRGKHVLLEKPPAMNARELRRLASVRGDRVVACASSRFRLYESARVASEFLSQNALGPLRVLRSRAIHPAGPPPETPPPAWRLRRDLNGGGILANWGVYELDYLLGLTGWSLVPQTVMASCWGLAPEFADRAAPESDAETHVVAHIQCAGGATIVLERAEISAAPTDEAWQITGQRGSLRFRLIPDRGREILHDSIDPIRGIVTRPIWQGEESYASIHAGPVQDFVSAILDKRAPATDLDRAILLQEILDAVYASAQRGRSVRLPSPQIRSATTP